MAKSSKLRLLWVPIALAGAGLAVLGAMNPTNFTATHPDHANARLRTRRYRCSIGQAREAIEAAVPALGKYGRPWRMIESSPKQVRVEVPVLVFTDDLVVTLREEKESVWLDVKSSARMGRSDLGENRRHVLQLLAVLDEKLPAF
jgi:uncharacterized protein (DUF1499 family)